MFGMYLRYHVPRSAAALSYFLTLTVFPLMICLYTMLRQYIPDPGEIIVYLKGIIPDETLDTLSEYMAYIVSHSSGGMFVAGVIVMMTSSSAAYRELHNIFAEMQGSGRYRGLLFLVFSFLFSVAFLIIMYFAVIVVLSGDWLLNFIASLWPRLDVSFAWQWLKYVLLFALLLFLLLGIYRLSAPKGAERHLLAGALCGSAALVGVSILFSWFIGMSTRYSLVYGSLASIIILMFWLYVCGLIIIMGNTLNIVLRDLRAPEPEKPLPPGKTEQ